MPTSERNAVRRRSSRRPENGRAALFPGSPRDESLARPPTEELPEPDRGGGGTGGDPQPGEPGAEPEHDVALGPLRPPGAEGHAVALGARAGVAHHEARERRHRDREQHPVVAEEGAEAEERRELGIAVDDRIDERAAAA